MKVITDIRRLDIIHFNLILLPRLRSTYVTIVGIAILVAVFIIWDKGTPETTKSLVILIVASLGGGLGGMLAGIIISITFILSSSSKTNGVLGQHEYEITSEGLFEKTEANEALSRWSGIQDVRKVGSYMLFKISGYLFHIIPKRSFDNEGEFQEFLKQATEKWRKAT